MSYTVIFIIITIIISIAAFNNRDIVNKFIMYPRIMHDPKEYYRLLSSGFIHGDWGHLAFNMYALYIFGRNVEPIFDVAMGKPFLFPVLYLLGIVVSSLPDMAKHKNDSSFSSLGASGGVSAVVFSFVYFYPWQKMGLLFIPIMIPAIFFAALYIIYCIYMSKNKRDNVNHDAHLWGSLFGLVFCLLFDPTHGRIFVQQLLNPVF